MKKNDFKNNIFSLADRIYPMVFRLLKNEEEAKDAIQEVMIVLWNRRTKLAEHPNQKGFVFLTARNYCLDLLKRRKIETVNTDVASEQISSRNGHENYELKELTDAINEILSHCPEQHREILMLRDMDGCSYEEIAVITGLNVKHLRVILSRTRKFVQEKLKKNFSYE